MPGAGREVAIEWRGREARAWVPDPLGSRDLTVPERSVRVAERAVAAVRLAAETLAPGWEPLARLLLRAEGVASSRIEGLRAPADAVAAAELDPAVVPEPAGWVADNLAVVTAALEHAGVGSLTTPVLHRWHHRLMVHSGLPESHVGAFRTQQGWIGGRSPLDAVYVPPPPDRVPALMDDLIAFSNRTDLDAVTQAAVAHAQFETIHPYGDGNGRIGRVLVLWTFARRLGIAVPPPVSPFIARDPGGYLGGLLAFRTGDLAQWVDWFADVVMRASDAVSDWTTEVAGVLERWRSGLTDLRADAAARRVLEILPAHPVISAALAAEELGVSAAASRHALTTLGERGVLTPYEPLRSGPGRPRHLWVAPDLVDLVTAWGG